MVIGLLAFVLYFIYDLNEITLQNKIFQKFFFLGTLILVLGTFWMGFCSDSFVWIWLVPALLFFGLLIYTLFFALPFEATYVDPAIGRKVYSGGIYGVCRHPGFWWLLFAYVCLGMACGSEMMRFGLFCSFLNLLYIGFQDMVIFPRIFVDYGDYKRKVPFLIPRRKHNAISR